VSLFESPWAQLGAVGVVFMFVLLLATGRLVPRSVAKTMIDQANTEAARWRAAAEADAERADLVARQNGELVAAMRSVEALVRLLLPNHRDAA